MFPLADDAVAEHIETLAWVVPETCGPVKRGGRAGHKVAINTVVVVQRDFVIVVVVDRIDPHDTDSSVVIREVEFSGAAGGSEVEGVVHVVGLDGDIGNELGFGTGGPDLNVMALTTDGDEAAPAVGKGGVWEGRGAWVRFRVMVRRGGRGGG